AGQQVASVNGPAGTITVSPVRNIIRIGNDETADRCLPVRDFRGKIDQVRITKTALSSAAIAYDAAHSLTPGDTADGNGNSVPDECETIGQATVLAVDFEQ